MTDNTHIQACIDAAKQVSPVGIYCGYRDEAPDALVTAILGGNLEEVDAQISHIEDTILFHDDSIRHLFEEWLDDNNLGETPELWDTWMDNAHYDFEGYIRDLLRSTKPRVVATIIKQSGEGMYFPCADYTAKDNMLLELYHQRVHGWDGWAAEACYSDDALKIIGTVDLLEMYKKLVEGYIPTRVHINSGMKVLHNGGRGSGGLGELPDSKAKRPWYRCTLDNDRAYKYGVDATFGFVDSVWQDQLELRYENRIK